METWTKRRVPTTEARSMNQFTEIDLSSLTDFIGWRLAKLSARDNCRGAQSGAPLLRAAEISRASDRTPSKWEQGHKAQSGLMLSVGTIDLGCEEAA
jgi:hypothetical protein